MKLIEILSPYPSGAVHRMKLKPLVEQKPGGLECCDFGKGGDKVAGVVINGLTVPTEQALARLAQCAKQSVIMMLIPDVDMQTAPALKTWSKLVDVFLLPTPEMQQIVQSLTDRPVEILFDPIDFGFEDSYSKSNAPEAVPKVVWFGFPDSYQKSMALHAPLLTGLHKAGRIEYHIVSRHTDTNEREGCILHQYDAETFPELLQTFDLCVTSHIPADFDINSYSKSENKAVLAINRGVPVIASRTPANARLLEACGLGEYLFSSGAELVGCVEKLSSRTYQEHYLSRSQPYVLEHYTARAMAAKWLEVYEKIRAAKFAAHP